MKTDMPSLKTELKGLMPGWLFCPASTRTFLALPNLRQLLPESQTLRTVSGTQARQKWTSLMLALDLPAPVSPRETRDAVT